LRAAASGSAKGRGDNVTFSADAATTAI
jgi:hypothetical protein